ncbi:unnamed protein product [Closterium sp. NIES-65]|nr:unnamed protein product [Closterium sp. NIES-65]
MLSGRCQQCRTDDKLTEKSHPLPPFSPTLPSFSPFPRKQKVLQLHPSCPPSVRLGIGLCHLRLFASSAARQPAAARREFHAGKARQALERVLQLEPGNADALVALGLLDVNSDDVTFENSQKSLQPPILHRTSIAHRSLHLPHLSVLPSAPSPTAVTAVQRGQQRMLAAFHAFPFHPMALNHLANHAFLAGPSLHGLVDPLAALALASTEASLPRAEAYYCLARTYHAQGDRKKAFAYYKAATETVQPGEFALPYYGTLSPNPLSRCSLSLAGQIQLSLGDAKAAVGTLEKVLAVHPTNSDALKVRQGREVGDSELGCMGSSTTGSMLSRLGKAWMLVTRRSARLVQVRALVEVREGREGGTVSWGGGNLQKVLAVHPINSHAFKLVGAIHLQQGRQDQALACFRKITQHCPSDMDAWLEVGELLVSSDLPAALESLKKVRSHPRHTSACEGGGQGGRVSPIGLASLILLSLTYSASSTPLSSPGVQAYERMVKVVGKEGVSAYERMVKAVGKEGVPWQLVNNIAALQHERGAYEAPPFQHRWSPSPAPLLLSPCPFVPLSFSHFPRLTTAPPPSLQEAVAAYKEALGPHGPWAPILHPEGAAHAAGGGDAGREALPVEKVTVVFNLALSLSPSAPPFYPPPPHPQEAVQAYKEALGPHGPWAPILHLEGLADEDERKGAETALPVEKVTVVFNLALSLERTCCLTQAAALHRLILSQVCPPPPHPLSGVPSTASSSLRCAPLSYPSYLDCHLRLAVMALDRRDNATAMTHPCYSCAPDSVDALLLRSRAEAERDDHAAAKDTLKRIVDLSPEKCTAALVAPVECSAECSFLGPRKGTLKCIVDLSPEKCTAALVALGNWNLNMSARPTRDTKAEASFLEKAREMRLSSKRRLSSTTTPYNPHFPHLPGIDGQQQQHVCSERGGECGGGEGPVSTLPLFPSSSSSPFPSPSSSPLQQYEKTLKRFFASGAVGASGAEGFHLRTLSYMARCAQYDADQLAQCRRSLLLAVHVAPNNAALRFNVAVALQKMAVTVLKQEKRTAEQVWMRGRRRGKDWGKRGEMDDNSGGAAEDGSDFSQAVHISSHAFQRPPSPNAYSRQRPLTSTHSNDCLVARVHQVRKVVSDLKTALRLFSQLATRGVQGSQGGVDKKKANSHLEYCQHVLSSAKQHLEVAEREEQQRKVSSLSLFLPVSPFPSHPPHLIPLSHYPHIP